MHRGLVLCVGAKATDKVETTKIPQVKLELQTLVICLINNTFNFCLMEALLISRWGIRGVQHRQTQTRQTDTHTGYPT